MKKAVLKNFAIFTERPATLLKKRLQHKCFHAYIVKLSRTSKTFANGYF